MMKSISKYVLISAAIIGGLYFVAIGSFNFCDFTHLFEAKAKIDIKILSESVQRYESENGFFPKVLDALEGSYLNKIPQDPWGNEYHYISNESDVIIFSYGDLSKEQFFYQIENKKT
ncbi:type II secretion system protein GspG [Arenicella xantha]|uniref:Type II secretion system (T2SS) protein G n=1 Tax=Arenicella xantha TaxID=644221 RepID=A0A395JGM8_9GAMM|nr:type II secretion system protein GspG [Arenicella xantha]RBP44822.1 type II secretion system (T2SS) protein G [Arenicella xantha]